MSGEAPVIAQSDGHVLTVTLNMPERRNPVSDNHVVDALCAAMQAADSDMDVRVVILTGAGSAFSSGGDLKAMQRRDSGLRASLPARTRRNYREGIQRLPLMFEALEVPVIAAVNGPAIGAGCDLACMCDIRIAGRSARFAESFVKLGILPGDGGSWLLPRIVGFSKASEMALTGDSVDAEEALKIGLVSRVVDDADLMDEARAMANRIAANPPYATRMTKRMLRKSWNAELETVLEIAGGAQALLHETADHQEALDAFVEKRAPVFRGE